MAITKIEVERVSVISSKPFEKVVKALRAAVVRPDMPRSIHALGPSAEACREVRRARVDSLSKLLSPPSKYFSPHSASLRFCSR
jgi:hypothetical protein